MAEFTDKVSSVKARRPGLEELMRDAHRGRFDVVLVWVSDRIARSTRHFLEILDELNRLGVKFSSFREPLDTDGRLGRALVVIIGTVAELEGNLNVERVRAGMRRARFEDRQIGSYPAGNGPLSYSSAIVSITASPLRKASSRISIPNPGVSGALT